VSNGVCTSWAPGASAAPAGIKFESTAVSNGTASASQAQNTTKLYSVGWSGATLTSASYIMFYVKTADNSANLYDFGLYGPNCKGGQTNVPLIAHTGAVAGSSINSGGTGTAIVALSGAPITTNLVPGWYCIGITSSVASPTLIVGLSSTTTYPDLAAFSSATSASGTTSGGVLNPTVTAPTLNMESVNAIWVKIY